MDFSSTPIMDLAVIIASHLSRHDISTCLVGGLAVEYYSDNLYQTLDIDLVNINYTQANTLHSAMQEIGFIKKGKVFTNPTTPITVEFPTGPLAVGNAAVISTGTAKTKVGDITILLAPDIVCDRIARFMYWRDNQALAQAVSIMVKHNINPNSLKDFISLREKPCH